jgi:hypothetical protein
MNTVLEQELGVGVTFGLEFGMFKPQPLQSVTSQTNTKVMPSAITFAFNFFRSPSPYDQRNTVCSTVRAVQCHLKVTRK